jgi:hypothetical protein
VVRELLRLEGDRAVHVHARREEAFRWACHEGHLDVVCELLRLGGDRAVDVHADEELTRRLAEGEAEATATQAGGSAKRGMHSPGGRETQGKEADCTVALPGGDTPAYPSGTAAELKSLLEVHDLKVLQPWGVDVVLVMTWSDTTLPGSCLQAWQAAIPGPCVPFVHLHHVTSWGDASAFQSRPPFHNVKPPLRSARSLLWRVAPGDLQAVALPPWQSQAKKVGIPAAAAAAQADNDAAYSPWRLALADVVSIGALVGAPGAEVWEGEQLLSLRKQSTTTQ